MRLVLVLLTTLVITACEQNYASYQSSIDTCVGSYPTFKFETGSSSTLPGIYCTGRNKTEFITEKMVKPEDKKNVN